MLYIHINLKSNSKPVIIKMADDVATDSTYTNIRRMMSDSDYEFWSTERHMVRLSEIASVHLYREVPEMGNIPY